MEMNKRELPQKLRQGTLSKRNSPEEIGLYPLLRRPYLRTGWLGSLTESGSQRRTSVQVSTSSLRQRTEPGEVGPEKAMSQDSFLKGC